MQLLSVSQNASYSSDLLGPALYTLLGLANNSPQRADAILTAGGLTPLVQLLRSDRANLQLLSARALSGVARAFAMASSRFAATFEPGYPH